MQGGICLPVVAFQQFLVLYIWSVMSAAVLHLPVSLHPLGEGHVNDNAALGFEAGRYNQGTL